MSEELYAGGNPGWYGQFQQPSTWWGSQPAMPWGTAEGQQPWPAWEDFYGQAPGGAPEVQSWMNAMLPWYQQAQNQQQFGAQMDYQRWMQEQQLGWSREQQAAEIGWGQEQQAKNLEYQRWLTSGSWGQEQEQQAKQLEYQRWQASGGWEQEAARQAEQLAAQSQMQERDLATQVQIEQGRQDATREQAAWSAFGRRYQPNARWLR